MQKRLGNKSKVRRGNNSFASLGSGSRYSPLREVFSAEELVIMAKEGAAGAPRGDSGNVACLPDPTGAAPMLDTHTPQRGHFGSSVLSGKARRIFSRASLGMKVPGRYYFITWTSSPTSPDIKKSWQALKKYLRRQRPKSPHLHVITTEGHGVIHLIIRIAKGEKRLEVTKLREHWKRLHNATQIRAEYVKNPENLANYLKDQRKKKRMAAEMMYQPGISSWGYSKGWLPRAFSRAFGRFWHQWAIHPAALRDEFLKGWLLASFEDSENVNKRPYVDRHGGVIGGF